MRIVYRASLAAALVGLAGILSSVAVAADETRLLRQPAVSDEHLAFVYAGDLWVADRDGANPRRLTSDDAEENNPRFSPDGSRIAFAAAYDGNTDVYVIPVAGGQPERLTWHPGEDVPVGWTPDGESVAFTSRRESDIGSSPQLYRVSRHGGAPIKEMEARFFRGEWNQDGDRLAYIDFGPAYNGLYGGSAGWRGYRGGRAPSIRILDLETDQVERIEGERMNDLHPTWVDGEVYFLSDRVDERLNLFRYDEEDGEAVQLTDQSDWDIRWFDGHDGQVVYEAGGRLHEMDLADGDTRPIRIDIDPDLAQQRTRRVDAADNLQDARISPNAKRAIVTARGEIFTVPVDEGSTRNLTNTDGQREYTGIWSPDGGEVAWLEESLDGQTLVVRDQRGVAEREEFFLGPEFYELRDWDAENGRILYTDNRQGLHYIDLDTGETRLIDTGLREGAIDIALSPDGRWVAYTKYQENFYRDLKVYHFDQSESGRISDGMADTASPVFSPDGKHLYFAASTNTGPRQFGLDMTSQERPYRAGLYAAVLREDAESPLLPGSGDEPASDESNDGDEQDPVTRIDFNGLLDRTVALQVAEGNYGNLEVAADGSLFYIESPQPGATREPPGQTPMRHARMERFDFDEREERTMLSGVNRFDISASGGHMLLQMANGSLSVAEIDREIEPEPLDLSGMRMEIDPQEEWAQIFDEAWRMQRDFFYADNLHEIDWDAVYEQYQPLVEHVGRREDLNELMIEMIAELFVGHNRLGGGDVHEPRDPPDTGLLGANFSVDQGRYRIERIYSGESWNPFLEGPLSVPGRQAREGEYIIAINGREIGANENLFKRLKDTAGEQILLTVGPDPRGHDAREIEIEPVASEGQLRLWGWVEDNRRRVAEATDGRVGYIYLPDTAGGGYRFFNRMFHAQLDKEALIIDERDNSGGQAANYITEVLSRDHLANWAYREGMMSRTPQAALHGPKVMMIDQDAGSGGDFLPYAFRELDIGKLVGTRTWGGLIGISRNPALVDGGFMTVPHFRFIDTDNQWSIENEGVAPDIEVELDPVATNEGRDTQLERTIEIILEELENWEDEVSREQPPLPTQPGR